MLLWLLIFYVLFPSFLTSHGVQSVINVDIRIKTYVPVPIGTTWVTDTVDFTIIMGNVCMYARGEEYETYAELPRGERHLIF